MRMYHTQCREYTHGIVCTIVVSQLTSPSPSPSHSTYTVDSCASLGLGVQWEQANVSNNQYFLCLIITEMTPIMHIEAAIQTATCWNLNTKCAMYVSRGGVEY